MVTTGNSFGTVCGWQSYMADVRFPTFDGSTSSYFWYGQSSITGTMPTEFGMLTGSPYFGACTGRVGIGAQRSAKLSPYAPHSLAILPP